MLQLVDRLRGFAGEVFHGVGVTEPVGTLHRVVHVPLPTVGAHVAKRGGDATLRGHGVAAGREDLGDAGGAQALLGHAKGRAQTGTTGADHHHVEFVGLVFVGCH